MELADSMTSALASRDGADLLARNASALTGFPGSPPPTTPKDPLEEILAVPMRTRRARLAESAEMMANANAIPDTRDVDAVAPTARTTAPDMEDA